MSWREHLEGRRLVVAIWMACSGAPVAAQNPPWFYTLGEARENQQANFCRTETSAHKVADVFEEFGPRPGYAALQATDRCWVAVETFTPQVMLREVIIEKGKPNEYLVRFVEVELSNGETAYLVTTREVKAAE